MGPRSTQGCRAPAGSVSFAAAARAAAGWRRGGIAALAHGALSEVVVDSFGGYTVAELKTLLRDRGLKVSGAKAELVERLTSHAQPADVQVHSNGHADYSSKTVTELKALLRERGLKISGTKPELIERLETSALADQPAAADADPTPAGVAANLSGKTVAELKAMLGERGLKVGGTKPELIARLEVSGIGKSFQIGQKLLGTVKNITNFGAFVGVGADRDGLVPLAKMAEGVVRNANDIVSLGAEVDVWVSNIRPDGALELSMVERKAGLRRLADSERLPVRELRIGQALRGFVRNLAAVGAFVDVGAQRDGLIHNSRIPGHGPSHAPLSVGQQVHVRVVNIRDDGALELQQISEAALLKLHELPRTSAEDLRIGEELTGVVTMVVSYGAFVDVGAERHALVPRSKLPEAGIAEGEEVRVWVTRIKDGSDIELSAVEGDVSVSEGATLLRVSDLELGQRLTGRVADLADYGVFVDIGAERKGLVPNSKLADPDGEDGEDEVELEVGQEVTVWISNLRRNGDIELSMIEGLTNRMATGLEDDQDPLEVGQQLQGTVMKIVDYGVFVDIGSGRYGLVPIPMMAEENMEQVEQLVELGKEVTVWVSHIRKRGCVELGMISGRRREKQLRVLSGFAGADPKEWHTGRVSAVHDWGIFVMLQPPFGGPEEGGLVHISQVSGEFLDNLHDLVQVDQELSVRVIRVDLEGGRMELSMLEPL